MKPRSWRPGDVQAGAPNTRPVLNQRDASSENVV